MKARYIPNIMSITRLPVSMALLFLGKYPVLFLTFYVLAGILDVFDGIVARRFNWQSELGEKLDSIGDWTFIACAVLAAALTIDEIHIPLYCYAIFAVLLAGRAVNMAITWVKFRKVGYIHTRSSRWAAIPIYILLPTSIFLGYLPTIPLAIFLVLTTIAQCEETWILHVMKPGEYTMSIKSYWEWKRDRDRALSAAARPEKEAVTVG